MKERKGVKMRKIPKDMMVGFKHDQRDGVAEIVSYKSYDSVLVRFENGYEALVQAGQVRKGSVKNRMLPTVFGVGYMGKGGYKSCNGKGGEHSKIYQDWINMLGRCYNPEVKEAYPSYQGCTVFDSWFNFQNFSEWYTENYPRDGGVYHLDKDILSSGVKIYSPSTCIFVSPFDNYQKAHAKNAELKSPDGDVVIIYNVSKFCRDNGLSQSAMSAVKLGKRKSHKGWSRVE